MSEQVMEMDHDWLFGDDTGMSSKVIWRTMYGIHNPRRDYPHDPDDLGRCIRLLRRHPEWLPRMGEMVIHGGTWKALSDRWSDLTRSYESEEPEAGARRGWIAPNTYRLMREVIDSARTPHDSETEADDD